MMEQLTTSYSANAVCVEIIQDTLYIVSLPKLLKERDIMLFVADYSDKEYNKIIFAKGQRLSYKMPSLSSGIYSLNIWYSGNDGYFYSYLSRSQILIRVSVNGYSFFDSPIHMRNSVWFARFSKSNQSNPNFLKPCNSIQSTDSRIKALAKEITADLLLPYSKVLAVHDWIANNISYDYDALRSESYKTDDASAIATMENRRGVCQGYTNLSVALLRSLNIPCSELSCFSLGIDTQGGWECQENLNRKPNHVITISYVANRWLFMDTTWDSNNRFESGAFIAGKRCSHLYFDTYIRFLSNTHRFTY